MEEHCHPLTYTEVRYLAIWVTCQARQSHDAKKSLLNALNADSLPELCQGHRRWWEQVPLAFAALCLNMSIHVSAQQGMKSKQQQKRRSMKYGMAVRFSQEKTGGQHDSSKCTSLDEFGMASDMESAEVQALHHPDLVFPEHLVELLRHLGAIEVHGESALELHHIFDLGHSDHSDHSSPQSRFRP